MRLVGAYCEEGILMLKTMQRLASVATAIVVGLGATLAATPANAAGPAELPGKTTTMLTADSPSVPLADGENGWGWDAATRTLTLRNYDDSAYNVTKPTEEDATHQRRTGLGIYLGGMTSDQQLTIKFEGNNTLSATARSDAIIAGIQIFAGKGNVVFEGADDSAILNLHPKAFYSQDMKVMADLAGIAVESANKVELTKGTINITGTITQENVDDYNNGNGLTAPKLKGVEVTTDSGLFVTGNASLNINLDAPSSVMSLPIWVMGAGSNVTFDTTGTVNLVANQNAAIIASDKGTCTYSGKGNVTYKPMVETDKVYLACEPKAAEGVLIGALDPVNTSHISSIQGEWAFGLFRGESDGKSPAGSVTVGQVNTVDVAVENADEAKTSVEVDGVATDEVIAAKHISVKHGEYALANALGTTTPAIAPGAAVTLSAPKAEGFTATWQLLTKGVTLEDLGLSQADLSNASLTYTQPGVNVAWQITYAKDTKPSASPSVIVKAKKLPKSGC